jgi:hypothetical protein
MFFFYVIRIVKKRRMKDEGKAILLPASCDAGKNNSWSSELYIG